jgi:hypothetical protein
MSRPERCLDELQCKTVVLRGPLGSKAVSLGSPSGKDTRRTTTLAFGVSQDHKHRRFIDTESLK